MNVILCLDDKNGMLFNKRRQSSDSCLRESVFNYINGKKLYMNRYTEKQFCDCASKIIVDNDFLSKAEADDFCFVEDSDISLFINEVKAFIIYRWNRVYPSDVKFPSDHLKNFKLISKTDFSGSSHEKITMEVYERV